MFVQEEIVDVIASAVDRVADLSDLLVNYACAAAELGAVVEQDSPVAEGFGKIIRWSN